MARLYTDQLAVGYGASPIVKDLTLTIPDKQVTTIIGANGSGKSTLLKAMTRLIPYTSGHVCLDGQAIQTEPTKKLAQKMAILPQAPEGSEGLTVYELVSYGRFPYQSALGRLSPHDYDVVNWALDVTQVSAFKDRAIDSLSGGQRQRVWIAMALAQETDIIFLDEPTTYLDMAHQLEVLTLLEKLNQEEGRTIIMVLHDINQAARFSDYIVALKDGVITKTGTPEDILTKDVLKAVFHIDAVIGKDPTNNKPMCLTYNLLKGDN
ncbi:iron complex transport system ATP-binding protein [Halolactibacillus halophilus]|uniref:Iron complex transport system ATP-binding protein n=1 Tax=Halolactibacillus halophilus TaxID=306540 RepID=A0A1I5PYE6_9BACI|nr:ABC transporter ATP-binding protein [Halolactibacillus halophilus]GEM02244.1 iron-dicitrate ABC transporter ATP-binding protein [Halolactibacillus halophilus]SFP38656.1 iron complex transport system ATP-binding protein [Halolactibacillus halophilus]